MKKFLSSKLFRAIWSLALAALLYYVCPPCFSKTTLAIVLVVLLILVNASEFISRFAIITHIARFLVGGLFIFSGFIKANDPLGFSYKLGEYFQVFKEDTGLNFFGSMEHIALPLSIILCVSEMALGFMLLIGYKRNLTLSLLFAQIAFFTFLTFYSACFNKVTTCGCFGDFLVLKPWTSFWKDVALLILITLLISGRENINELFTGMITVSLTVIAIILSFAFPIYAYRNLPPLDFRPYAVGMNIKKNMETPPDYQPAVYESGFIYENLKTGKQEHFTMKNYPWEDTLNWKWVSTENILIKDAVHPPKIVDFSLLSLDGADMKDSVLNNKDYMFLLVCYDLSKTDDDETLHAKINDLYKLAEADHIKMLALTASDAKQIDDYKHNHQALYDFANADGIVLKTMIRSNPGLILIKDGTIIMNWHHNNFPTYSEVKQKYMK